MTPSRLMRALFPTLRASNNGQHGALCLNTRIAVAAAAPRTRPCHDPASCLSNCRCFALVNDAQRRNREFWFGRSSPHSWPSDPQHRHPDHDRQPADERTIQLGRSVRILHERLPTLLKEPLPSDILSPSITLHLFPSTHPHLPTVSGRLAYVAALWTAPVAWGRFPLIGNVKLNILSERMLRNGSSNAPLATREDKLIVKWKTCGRTTHRDGTGGVYRGLGLAAAKDPVDKIKGFIAGTLGDTPQTDSEEFCGIFIFEFDENGKIRKHTIEHTEEGGHWDKMTRVVSVTDWLLGHFNGKKKEDTPALAWCEERPSGGSIRLVDRQPRF